MALSALYIHVPFCKRRCAYCDFASSTARFGDLCIYAYEQKLLSFIQEFKANGLLSSVSTAYVGGGTPTMLGPELLEELLHCVDSSCGDKSQKHLKEFSFEANPDSLDSKALQAAKRSGATRVSLGVQSFVDTELEALGRVHSARIAEHALKDAVKSGLSISCDLMCGIPYQSYDSWLYSLEHAVATGVGHVSVYPLMIEEGTRMEALCEAGKLSWPDDDAQANYMELAEQILSAAGYKRYEVASYAKPGCECLHNIAYWTGKEYLGIGWSASSMVGRDSYKKVRTLLPQLPALEQKTERVRFTCASTIEEIIGVRGLSELHFDVEQLSAQEAVAEDLMLGARMTRGFSDALLQEASMLIGKLRVQETLEDLVKRNLLTYNEGRYKPTHTGWLLGNELYGALWDLAKE